ncbi:MAG: dihydropteroate synthase [Epsilonproteobacteria bacterium]|nr:dihydropteroate synthase [Campylobacterota bacterium]
MKIYKISTDTPIKKLLLKLGVTKEGLQILSAKSKLHFLYIKDLRTPAANILKQDALSIGADLAVPKNCVTCEQKYCDGILIATTGQIKRLSRREKVQPFGLKEIGNSLTSFLNIKNSKTKIMGVLNANEDSFFSQSRFDSKSALDKIEKMILDGADFIDIGGVSSRPGSLPISEKDEFDRVKSIIDIVSKYKLYEKIKFSLDSYSPLCLKYALNNGFSVINDITALQNDKVAQLASSYNATVILMHKIGTTEQMQKDPCYDNVILDIDDFFQVRVEKAKRFGIKDIILDVGIGFGKTLEHNLTLLQNMEHFLHFDLPLLVGASRKSMINIISPSETKDRLPGTLAIHLEAVRKGASIVRVHDVKEHVQALKVQDEILESS